MCHTQAWVGHVKSRDVVHILFLILKSRPHESADTWDGRLRAD